MEHIYTHNTKENAYPLIFTKSGRQSAGCKETEYA